MSAQVDDFNNVTGLILRRELTHDALHKAYVRKTGMVDNGTYDAVSQHEGDDDHGV